MERGDIVDRVARDPVGATVPVIPKLRDEVPASVDDVTRVCQSE